MRVLGVFTRVIKWGDVSAGGSVWKGKSLSERSASVPTVSDGGRPYSRLLTLLRLSEKPLSLQITIHKRRE